LDSNTSSDVCRIRRGRIPGLILFGLLFLCAILAPAARAQTEVKIGVKASGTMKSPLYLEAFRVSSGAGGMAREGRGVVRRDFDLCGIFTVADVEAHAGKLDAEPGEAGAVRVAGLVEPSGAGFQFTGEAFDVGTGESAFRRVYTGAPEDLRSTMHRFVDDVLEAMTGERGVAETKIAYVRQNGNVKEIWISDYDGANARQLTHDHSIALSPAWAPWGTEICFTSYKRGNPDLYLFDLGRGASYPFSTRPGPNSAPSYSPDGKWIACSLYRDGNAEIYLISRDAQTARRLTRNDRIDTAPSFSPTGQQIVFSSDRSGAPQIYVMGVDGLNQRLLTIEGTYNDSPQWSPKGDRIAYAARHDGVFDVIVMGADGSNPLQITYGAGHNENPHWSPDGRKIVFSSTRTGPREIFMMNPDGSDVVQITNGRECFGPAWGPRPRRTGP
jgi:TolB protein